MGVDHVDQVVVYVRGDVIIEHGGFQRGTESADAGHGHVLLDAVGIQRRHGVPVVFVLRIHVFVCFFAYPSVLAGEQADVASVGHFGLFALLVQDGAELEVRVGQHGVGIVHHPADLRQLRQQFFLLIREDVRLVPQDLVQEMRVDCETRLCFDPAAQPVRGDARQFRREEARRFHDACVGHHRLIRQRLEFRDAVILAAAQTCVGIGFAELALDGISVLQRSQQRLGTVVQAALILLESLREFQALLQILFASGSHFVHRFHVPGIFSGSVFSVLCHRGTSMVKINQNIIPQIICKWYNYREFKHFGR